MKTVQLIVPGPAQLLTLNAERSMHHMDRHKIVKAWRHTAGVIALVAKLPHFDRVDIVADIEQAHGRLADSASHFPCVKACIDGLVDAGVLDDDDPEHVGKLVQSPPTRGDIDQVTLTIMGVETPRPKSGWTAVDLLHEMQSKRNDRIAREQRNCPHVKRVGNVCIECGQVKS